MHWWLNYARRKLFPVPAFVLRSREECSNQKRWMVWSQEVAFQIDVKLIKNRLCFRLPLVYYITVAFLMLLNRVFLALSSEKIDTENNVVSFKCLEKCMLLSNGAYPYLCREWRAVCDRVRKHTAPLGLVGVLSECICHKVNTWLDALGKKQTKPNKNPKTTTVHKWLEITALFHTLSVKKTNSSCTKLVTLFLVF